MSTSTVTYSVVEDTRAVEDIKHRAIRAALNVYTNEGEGVEIHCDADLPTRSGLGSSSSFMVCLLHALEAHKGRRVSPAWLAKEAIRYERDVLLDTVGYQDQVAAAFGGLNIIHFLPGGNFRVEPLVLPQERKRTLGRHLMLFLRALPVQHRKSHKHRLPTWTEKRPN